MTKAIPDLLPIKTVIHIRDTCLCLATQRAARHLARRFDAALRPFGLTNGQFSLMVALNQPEPPPIGKLAAFLGMDPSTLTAAVKPLARRGLLTIEPDAGDRRARRLRISPDGVALLRQAVEVWRLNHEEVEKALDFGQSDSLRGGLRKIETEGAAASISVNAPRRSKG